jgi:hypothetical protein
MADGSRTLKLSILADVDNLKKSLTEAGDTTDGFGTKLGDFGKVAGAAFLAAGTAALAYAGTALVEATKNAIADEEAQKNLALTLKNTTDATDAQIAAVESYITQVSLSKGVTDDELRPAFERLTRSTKDTEESQNLLNLALDVSTATGKPLETVANALGKAYDGNAASLGKLGLGIDSAILKSGDLDAITTALAENFGGFATERAETFSGKMDRLKIAFDEGKETIGSFVLDAITPLVTIIVEKIVPAVNNLSSSIGETLGPVFTNLSTFFKDTFIPGLTALWDYMDKYIIPIFKTSLTPVISGVQKIFSAIGGLVTDNTGFFKLLGAGLTAFLLLAKPVATFIGGTFKLAFSGIALIIDGISIAIKALVESINLIISGINLLISGYNIVNNLKPGAKDLPKIPKLAKGGMVNANSPYIVGEVGPELFVPSSGGRIVPNNKLGGGGGNIYINVSGAIDQEGTARQIVNVLNNSFYRGTNGANALAF